MSSRLTTASVPKAGPYDLVETLGGGAAGTVYKARHRLTGAVVAVKILAEDLRDNPALLRRFEREFRAARQLDHPHIVHVLDSGRADGVPYIAMEFVDGGSLGDLIQLHKRLPEVDAVRLAAQVGEALELAHRHGIIHRDVKPDNILVTTDGDAKLADLGLAKDTQDEVLLTRPGAALGTPHFMAPEQLTDARAADARSDVYGLGATLYQALTGELPFRSRGAMSVLRKKVAGELVPPRQLVPGLSERAEAAVLRALRTDPADRFATCVDFVEALTGVRPVVGKGSGKHRRTAGGERRAEVRFASNAETSCKAVLGERRLRWTAVVLDVSRSGLRMELNRRFERGTWLQVDLPPARDGVSRQVLVRVAHVRSRPPRKWVIGAAFERTLAADELEVLL
jgi:serine/threonine protein kinase